MDINLFLWILKIVETCGFEHGVMNNNSKSQIWYWEIDNIFVYSVEKFILDYRV